MSKKKKFKNKNKKPRATYSYSYANSKDIRSIAYKVFGSTYYTSS